MVSEKALCNSPNYHLLKELYLWLCSQADFLGKVYHFPKYPPVFSLMKQSTSLIAKPAVIQLVEVKRKFQVFELSTQLQFSHSNSFILSHLGAMLALPRSFLIFVGSKTSGQD